MKSSTNPYNIEKFGSTSNSQGLGQGQDRGWGTGRERGRWRGMGKGRGLWGNVVGRSSDSSQFVGEK